MEKLDCRIVHTLTGIWLTTPARRLGPVPATEPTPDSYVLVEKAGTPALRIDVYLKPDALYRETMALHWGDWIAVGCSDSVYLVPLTDTSVREVSLGDSGPWDYSSGFWPTDEFLLAVSGRGLVRFRPGVLSARPGGARYSRPRMRSSSASWSCVKLASAAAVSTPSQLQVPARTRSTQLW